MQPVVITDLSQLDADKIYTYADYLLWQFSERVELIKGKIFRMSPAPSKRHQRVLRKLLLQVGNYLELQKQGCELFSAPFDVRLPDSKKSKNSDKDIYTVVQPDLCIICDADKLDERGCIGAPDVIIEILSPGNSRKEMKIKYALYEENGVKEYWIVVPQEQFVQQFALNAQGKYELVKIYTDEDTLTTPLFPDLHVDLSRVFEQ